jgi:hypothetical protein
MMAATGWFWMTRLVRQSRPRLSPGAVAWKGKTPLTLGGSLIGSLVAGMRTIANQDVKQVCYVLGRSVGEFGWMRAPR